MGQSMHRKAMDYFRQYLIVGGMPQAVQEYVLSKDFDKVDKTVERNVTSLQKYKENAKAKDLSNLKIKMPTPPIKSK